MTFTPPSLSLPPLRFELPPLERLMDLRPLDQQLARLEKRVEGEVGRALGNRLDELRKRLRAAAPRSGAKLAAGFRTATEVIGRERLLLQLYLLDESEPEVRAYLPPFDKAMCAELLGGSVGQSWFTGMRAADLFLTHFARLPARETLGRHVARILADGRLANGKSQKWRECRDWLFRADGPKQLVDQLRPGEKLPAGAQRCGVPQPSSFYALAQQPYLFARLKKLPLTGDDAELFAEVREQAPDKFEAGTTVGVHALQILIRRALRENAGQLPDRWGERIAEFASDPRLPMRSPAFAQWWGWANDKELAVALSWFTGRDLETFINLLEASLEGEAANMFPRRGEFLRRLYRAGKIRRARLVLVEEAFRDLTHGLRGASATAIARMNARTGISVICVRCEEFTFVEGTHNFAIQLHRELPVQGFWESADLSADGRRAVRRFNVTEFREGNVDSVRHVDSRWMPWEQKFLAAIQDRFHVFWGDVTF